MAVSDRTVDRSRTAMSRTFLSRPIQRAIQDGVITKSTSIFDYGCGRGGDVDRLRSMGHDVSGWDPAHRSETPLRAASVVNIGYVVNVIEDPDERRFALSEAWELATETLIVAARLDWDSRGVTAEKHRDGVVTGHNTFQKFYTQEELRSWIDAALECKSVAAEPGILYVFRNAVAEQRMLAHRSRSAGSGGAAAELWYRQNSQLLAPLETYLESHSTLPNPTQVPTGPEIIEAFGSIRNAFHVVRRATPSGRWAHIELPPSRSSTRRFEQNLAILTPLLDFLTVRGRLPRQDEMDSKGLEKEFGSVRAAFSLIRKITGPAEWADAESRARDDVLVYLSLLALSGRPRFGDLPSDSQYDIKDLFGSYAAAVRLSDELLFRAGDLDSVTEATAKAPFGKHTPDAFYVHASGVARLDPLLRVYEGCARVLTGEIPNANVLKMAKLKPQVSYLIYPDFDRIGHPELLGSIISRLGRLHVDYRSFAFSSNPPVLHRKELLVPPNYPEWRKFSRLSEAEQRAGLLSNPNIGTRAGWERALNEAGLVVRGHTLRRAK